MQSQRAKNIFKAAGSGDTNTISRLLPGATAEELKYEEEVCIVPCWLYFFCNISSNHLSNYKWCSMFVLCILITCDSSLFYCLTATSSCSKTLCHILIIVAGVCMCIDKYNYYYLLFLWPMYRWLTVIWLLLQLQPTRVMLTSCRCCCSRGRSM